MTEETPNHYDPTTPEKGRASTVAQALALLGAAGPRFATVLEHGTLLVEIYAPRGRDPQQAHTRDEVYVVAEGRGHFRNGERRHPFGPGDLLFVPACTQHRFEEFTDDLAPCVL